MKYGTVLVSAVALLGSGCANTPPAAVAGFRREDVRLTVYESDFGQVEEVRSLRLVKGANDVRVDALSKLIDPNTVLYEWLNGFPAEVVASTYELGAADTQSLLQRFEGKEVRMVWYGLDGRKGATVSGILERGESGQVFLRTGDGLLVNPTGTLLLPDKEGLAVRPGLSVRAKSQRDGEAKLQVAYLTRGLSWRADYALYQHPGKNEAALECWATIENRTGLDYPASKLWVVAGSPNRAVAAAKAREPLADEAKSFEVAHRLPEMPAKLGELYRYPIEDPGLIQAGRLNRVRLLRADAVSVVRDYSIALPVLSPYSDWGQRSAPAKQPATLSLVFKNNKENGLGLPLPSGAVRVYEVDEGGARSFIGAAGIGETPSGSKVHLTLSNAFDVSSEFVPVTAKRLDARTLLKDYQVTVRNAKTSAVRVRLVAPLVGNAAIASESVPGASVSAGYRQWTLDVPAESDVKLQLSVKFRT